VEREGTEVSVCQSLSLSFLCARQRIKVSSFSARRDWTLLSLSQLSRSDSQPPAACLAAEDIGAGLGIDDSTV
jgi:hypothetical protein